MGISELSMFAVIFPGVQGLMEDLKMFPACLQRVLHFNIDPYGLQSRR